MPALVNNIREYCLRVSAVSAVIVNSLLLIAALLPWRFGWALIFLPGSAALVGSALSRRWGTTLTRVILIIAFAGAAAVGCLTMFRPSYFERIEFLILFGQIALGVLAAWWIVIAWRVRRMQRTSRALSGQWIQLAVLAWLVLAMRGCSADQMILGQNHRTIPTPDARREVVMVDGRAVECWVARSPGQEPPRATVLYFIGKGGRADQWVSAVAWSWKERPIEVWAMNYPGSGGSAGPPRLDQVAPDALGVYEAVHRAHPERPIFLQAASFGTAVALCVAARHPVAGMILQNPPPLRQLIFGHYGWWNLWLLAGPLSAQVPPQLDSLANAAQCSAPAVFILSGADGVIPPRFQQQVWRAHLGPKHRIDVPTAGHSDALTREAAAQLDAEMAWLWQSTK